MQAVCAKFEIEKPEQVTFTFDGTKIQNSNTPMSLEMVDED